MAAAAAASLGVVSGCFGVRACLKSAADKNLASGCSFKCGFGFDAIQPCNVSRRRDLSMVLTVRASSATAVEDESSKDTEIPTPKVIIDQDSDPNATVVEITFGDRLGLLLDTMNALKNLGLNVVKANVFLDSSGKHNMFAITRADTGRKVEDPELLEAIRLTIINNLLEYHPVISSCLSSITCFFPGLEIEFFFSSRFLTLSFKMLVQESSAQLAMGAAFGISPPRQEVDVDIATHVRITDDGPKRSLLYVETVDRPGLLVDLVQIITEINIAVESGEFDTEGLLAKAKFHVSYRNNPISKPLQQVLANSLRYFLRRPWTEDSSF
ncbi:hypothetical protein QQ045_011442 [Rhodiola kirilowii]